MTARAAASRAVSSATGVAVSVAVALAAMPAALAAEAVTVVDARAGAAADPGGVRAALERDLAGVQGLTVIRNPASWRGDVDGTAVLARAIAAAGVEAQAALTADDCARTQRAAETLIGAGARLLVAGQVATGRTAARDGWAYALVCADRQGAFDDAARAARMLRGLDVQDGTSVGVPASAWARYPDVDVGLDELFTIHLRATEAGQPVADGVRWAVDHQAVAAPEAVVLAPGVHVVAVARGPALGAAFVDVIRARQVVDVPLEVPAPDPDQVVLGQLRQGYPLDGPIATQLLRSAGVRAALFVTSGAVVEVWGLPANAETAHLLDRGAASEPFALGAIVNDAVAGWDGRAPDPSIPLLREGTLPRARRQTPWWIYATIAGVTAVGAGLLYVNEIADDRQRFVVGGGQ